jgi:hypothetical protein
MASGGHEHCVQSYRFISGLTLMTYKTIEEENGLGVGGLPPYGLPCCRYTKQGYALLRSRTALVLSLRTK